LSIGRLGTIKNDGKLSEQAFENESIYAPKKKNRSHMEKSNKQPYPLSFILTAIPCPTWNWKFVCVKVRGKFTINGKQKTPFHLYLLD